MSVRLRLKRTGTRNASCFRIVAMDARATRDGKAIEEIGFYNPRTKEEKVNVERATYWKSCGAIVTDTVADIINRAENGIVLKDKVRTATPSKKALAKIKAEEEARIKAEEEAAAAAKAAEEAAAAEAAETPAE